ncbi:MAG TPA: hypothetical protein PL045_13940 [Chitinophagaceae bacterium]|nr:hypothetical protein [Chitinophagaceae bacterium]
MSMQIYCREEVSISGRKKTLFEVKSGDDNLLALEYDDHLNTVRVAAKNTRRLFILDKEGKVTPRIVLKNEYGFEMAHVHPVSYEVNKGVIFLSKDKFSYSLVIHPELSLFISNQSKPDSEMQFVLDKGFTSFKFTKSLHEFPSKFWSLIMCLAWNWQSLSVVNDLQPA